MGRKGDRLKKCEMRASLKVKLFSKHSFRNTILVSNSLDPDQARHSVGPDLGPTSLRWLLADDKKWPLARKGLIPVKNGVVLNGWNYDINSTQILTKKGGSAVAKW